MCEQQEDDFGVRQFQTIRLQTMLKERNEKIRQQNFKPKVKLYFEAYVLLKVPALSHLVVLEKHGNIPG